MANKRMFTKQITNSDAFLDMPVSSQLLYFHLNMEADDDGFVSSPKRIIKIIGANNDDLKILLTKRFLLAFESGVVVIKHWLLHNAVRKDMYKETQYLEEKKTLQIKDNMVYTEVRNESVTNPVHRLDQIRLDQDRIDIVAKSDTPYSLKEEIKKLYDSSRRDLNIIGLFFEYRQPKFENREQFEIALRRYLKPAKLLKEFSDNQIIDAIDYAKKEYKDIYTCETLLKILTK